MYSASAVDNATVACFWLSQLIAPTDIVNIIPIVESLSICIVILNQTLLLAEIFL